MSATTEIYKNSKRSSDVFDEFYQKLNDKQREAVDSTEGPVMVIAGPGTGKTQVLAMRIANILRNPDLQMNPQNILCLTFTDSGSTAMRNRLIQIIGPTAYYVKIHTFHSFCSEIIKAHPDMFPAINFVSDLEQIDIINNIIDELPATSPVKPYGEPHLYRQDLISCIKTLKREFISSRNLTEAINDIERFLIINKNIIESFISRNARGIKDEDCDTFIRELKENSANNVFEKNIQIITHFRKNSAETTGFKTQFKKNVKDFYEINLREIPKQKDLVCVYRRYEEELNKKKLFDYEDMILRVVKAFENDQALLSNYQEQFQYILVDEYQDTNGSQNQILDLLTSGIHEENPNIFVVGDDDQSIYRFQGASVENIFSFYKRYQSHIKLIVLDINYRSKQDILEVSESSIKFNSERITNLIPGIAKSLKNTKVPSLDVQAKTQKNNEEVVLENEDKISSVEIYSHDTLNDELFVITNQINELIKQGAKLSEIAVLFRDNKDAIPLIEMFTRLGLPYTVESGDDILRNVEICQLIDLLKVIHNPQSDNNLLFNVLNYYFIFQSECFRSQDINLQDIFAITRLPSLRKQNSTDHDNNRINLIETLLKHAKLGKFAEKILDFKQKSLNLRFDIFFEQVFKEFGYLNYILNSANKLEHLNRLVTLFNEIKNLIDQGSFIQTKFHKQETLEVFNLGDFINYINLLRDNKLKINAQPLKANINAVRLMTAHKSKGLEFEHIFIHKCVDKHWGNKRSFAKLKLPPGLIRETGFLLADDKNEDERRLFYVALTRAKHKIYLHYSGKYGNVRDSVPSMFLAELNQKHKLTIKGVDEYRTSMASEVEKLQFAFSSPSEAESLKHDLDLEEAFVNGLLEDYRLSITHLNNYLKCPRLFFYQNLLKVPSAKNKHASLGTAVHLALYDLHNSFKHREISGSTDQDRDLKYLLNRFKQHLEEEHLDLQDYKDSLEHGSETLTKYYHHYKFDFTQNKNTLLEFDFVQKNVHFNEIPITGRLDKIEIIVDHNGTHNAVNVVDYKTGNPSGKAGELKPGGNYYRQVVFYKLLCDLAHESGQFPYEMISGEIDFIQNTSDGKFIKKKIITSKEDIALLKKEISFTYQNIQQLKFDKTQDRKLCESCSFKNTCWQ